MSQPKCLICMDGCIDCENEETCKTCGGNFLMADGICQCRAGFYPDTNPDPDICQFCGEGCLSCADASECLTCDAKNNWAKVSDKHCDCASGHFKIWDESGTVRCNKCSPGCIKCYDENLCLVRAVRGSGLPGYSSSASSESDRQLAVNGDAGPGTPPTLAQVPQALRDHFD
jgi:hypothetical protein